MKWFSPVSYTNLLFPRQRDWFHHFHPRPPRLSPPQADDGGQEESDEDKNNPDDPVHPV